jgi:phospholipid/cholesterol/gamma-HCH transport system substrate-binding protein
VITRRTKIQLVIFVIITLVGVSYVGARYARLDRIVVDDAYTVVAHFDDSGGIFAGGEVTYRGVRIGRVDKLELTDEGVDVYLDIDNDNDEIPADALALVGNRSAVGEQYVELQPKTDKAPYFKEGSQIAEADTRLPIQTDQLLTDISNTVSSVDQEALRTTVSEVGAAFAGAGEDLQRIIDSGNSFIDTANDNFDITTALIEDGNTVLQGQVASESSLRTFASQLSVFSQAFAGSDGDLRQVIDTGSFTANQLRTFLEANRVDLGELIRNLATTGEVIQKRLPGIEQLLVVYPYVVEGSFTVVSKTPATGLYDAHFGLILNTTTPCHEGYLKPGETRGPQQRDDIPMDTDVRCDEPAKMTNARGAQNIPPRAPADYHSPVVASYDPATSKLTWGDPATLEPVGSVAPQSLGEESWKWLYLQPLMAH